MSDYEALRTKIPEKVCIIAATARSGSNFLADIMTATGQLGYPGEYFNLSATADVLGTISEALEERIRYLVSASVSPNGVLSIKVFPDHLPFGSMDFADFFPNPIWVWLRRRDLLAQAISWVIAIQTNAWSSFQPAVSPPIYDAKQIRQRLLQIISGNAKWELYFARNGIVPVALWYEDILTDRHGALGQIAARLGVSLPDQIGTANYRLQRTSMNQEWRDQFVDEYGDLNSFQSLRRAEADTWSDWKSIQLLRDIANLPLKWLRGRAKN